MQEVICFHCGNAVKISPDQSLCSECGEDLQHLLAPEFVAGYFYQRAQMLADQGEAAAALAQVERGLTYAASAELHLLAAILAQQVERYDQMRHHVAAIAVDDTLRPEAEWLLRAHQARQRALQGRSHTATRTPGAPSLLDELLGRNEGDDASTGGRPLQALWPALAVMALLGVVAMAYVYWMGDGPLPDAAQTSRAGDPATPEGQATLTVSPVAPAAAVTPESTPDTGIHLLPTPTPTSLADVAIAASTPRPVVIITAETFDLDRYLQENGYPHLAGLGVGARQQGTTLILRGVVQLDLQRRQLVEAASAVPGVSEVNTVDLVLMPAPTYTVQEGETLWSIVYDVYGNAEQMQDLIDLNRDVMPSPELLSPGTVLQIPPLQ